MVAGQYISVSNFCVKCFALPHCLAVSLRRCVAASLLAVNTTFPTSLTLTIHYTTNNNGTTITITNVDRNYCAHPYLVARASTQQQLTENVNRAMYFAMHPAVWHPPMAVGSLALVCRRRSVATAIWIVVMDVTRRVAPASRVVWISFAVPMGRSVLMLRSSVITKTIAVTNLMNRAAVSIQS